MRTAIVFLFGATLVCLSLCQAQQDTVLFDATTGNFVIQYLGDSSTGERDSLIRVVFEPATKVSPRVRCIVTFDTQLARFTYSYLLENGTESAQRLYKFILEFGTNASVEDLSKGFWHSKRLREIDESAGSSVSANRWLWRADKGLMPGRGTGGFVLGSSDPPGITDSYFQGYAQLLGFPDEGPLDALRQEIAKLTIFPANYVIRKTLTPVPIVSGTTPLAILDTLISYKHQALTLGWITNQGVANSLDQKLDNARKQLERGNSKAAKNMLEAFLNEVEAQRDKHLTSEAYALLKFNAEYLISKLTG